MNAFTYGSIGLVVLSLAILALGIWSAYKLQD
jgi:hypothetical protein